MAFSKVASKSATLRKSLRILNLITNEVYGNNIRDIALSMWQKQLSVDNPQWKFLQIKSFSTTGVEGSAHVMAMLDERLPGKGLVGYFACTNSRVGTEVLEQACDWLKTKNGITNVYGPINGTLPNDYRLNLDDDFIFPGEPVNPKWYLEAFDAAGFTVFNRYSSGELKHFNFWLKLSLKKPLKHADSIAVRPFSNEDHKIDFKKYHELRNLIFPFQSIYCPAISLEERVYNSSGKFDPNYTLFLTDNGREVGFIMAYIYKRRLIIKTIGLLPEYRGRGLSSLLSKPIHEQASSEGITTSIYAMVRVGNRVHNNKHPMVREFRKYVTMHKSL